MRFNRLGLVLHGRQRSQLLHDRGPAGLRAVALERELALVPEERRETFPVRVEQVVVVGDECFCYIVGRHGAGLHSWFQMRMCGSLSLCTALKRLSEWIKNC